MQNSNLDDFQMQYEICDGHAHIFPEKIAEKAVTQIGRFYGLSMFSGNGSVQALLKSGSRIGVTHYLVCSTATTAHQVESINHFVAEECEKHSEFVGFGTLHPDYMDPQTQVKFCMQNNLHGIKLHPDFQQFYIDDKKAYPIYEAAENKLPILFHMGDNRYDYSSPARLKKILHDFPRLTAFAAHFGGYQRWDEAVCSLAGMPNVYFDTSSTMAFLPAEKVKQLIHAFGTDRLFFGCDFPMWQHLEELKRFMALKLTEKENRQILSLNFKQFFHLL